MDRKSAGVIGPSGRGNTSFSTLMTYVMPTYNYKGNLNEPVNKCGTLYVKLINLYHTIWGAVSLS